MEVFIPSSMFPCRKSQTNRLKSRNFGSYQNGPKSSRSVKKSEIKTSENPI